MNALLRTSFALLFGFWIVSCGHAAPLVGGGCDGCELMFVGMPAKIPPTDTSPGWAENGQKLLLQGVVYARDGRTPAAGVVVYYWQTDRNGYYALAEGMDPRAKRHGRLRGWVKTASDGRYAIRTIRPAPYPSEDIPAHIHLSIKEPGIANEYHVDELVFDDDSLLTARRRKHLENRGGSAILRPFASGDVQVAEHDIILGLNIPNYPHAGPTDGPSGLSIGEDQPSFMPFHAYGPDKGSRACPVCKYGHHHGIIFFVGSHPDWVDIRAWLVFLEKESVARGKALKPYFVYGNEQGYGNSARRGELERLGTELNLKHVAVTFVPSLSDRESEIDLSRVDPSVASFQLILATLERTKSARVEPTGH